MVRSFALLPRFLKMFALGNVSHQIRNLSPLRQSYCEEVHARHMKRDGKAAQPLAVLDIPALVLDM